MALWKCTVCAYVYDETLGDPEHGIPAGTPWEDTPDLWLCPDCCAFKEDFEEMPD
ncbi:MAG: rubredoxin [Methylophilaceae bacterium]|nr:rubredoxin [Methylophilaceae bacterium]